MSTSAMLAWNLITELRQELREAQKIRAQVIGFKIVFVTASLGFVFAQRDRPPNYDLLLVPAFASVFFDFLIVSYGYSIKRIGYYCRIYLEPKIRPADWPQSDPLWEEAMSMREMHQHFAIVGNVGLTTCAVVAAILHLVLNSSLPGSYVVAGLLLALAVLDVLFSYFWKHTPRGKLPWVGDAEAARRALAVGHHRVGAQGLPSPGESAAVSADEVEAGRGPALAG